MQTLDIRTEQREQLLSVTTQVNGLVRDMGWKNGALLLFCPHTTAAVTVNESADPDVAGDIRGFMAKMVPPSASFAHAEGNSDAHIKAGLFGAHCLLIVDNGRVRLGTWQGVYFCEWDGPRERALWAQFLPGERQ